MPTRRQFLGASALLPAFELFAADYDRVIQDGRILDASQNLDRMAAVGIRAGKVAAGPQQIGMPLDQVTARVTANGARGIPEFKACGSLRVGVAADVTVLDLKEGDFDFVGNLDTIRRGNRELVTYPVVVGGKRVQA